MALQNPFNGFNVGFSFIPTPSDTNKITVDPANTKGVPFVWLVPTAVGALAATDLQGVGVTFTFTAKDLNISFPVPVTQVKAAGTVATVICVYPT